MTKAAVTLVDTARHCGSCEIEDPLCRLYVEAVRKGDVQGPMRERPGSAVGFAGGLDFHTERGSGDPHRLDERLRPEDGDHPLQIVRENVKARLRSDLFKSARPKGSTG
jgi:hypothetical protein